MSCFILSGAGKKSFKCCFLTSGIRLLKTGYQNSLLAHQIDRFACLYTSHVGNLVFYSPFKRYRGRVDHMAHEDFPHMDGEMDCEF